MTITGIMPHEIASPWKDWLWLCVDTDEGIHGVGEGTVNVFTRTDEVAVHELEGMISGRPHTRELKAGKSNGTAVNIIATARAPQLRRNTGG